MGNPIDLTDRVYIDAQFDNYQFETYDSLQIYYKIGDENFTIRALVVLFGLIQTTKNVMKNITK